MKGRGSKPRTRSASAASRGKGGIRPKGPAKRPSRPMRTAAAGNRRSPTAAASSRFPSTTSPGNTRTPNQTQTRRPLARSKLPTSPRLSSVSPQKAALRQNARQIAALPPRQRAKALLRPKLTKKQQRKPRQVPTTTEIWRKMRSRQDSKTKGYDLPKTSKLTMAQKSSFHRPKQGLVPTPSIPQVKAANRLRRNELQLAHLQGQRDKLRQLREKKVFRQAEDMARAKLRAQVRSDEERARRLLHELNLDQQIQDALKLNKQHRDRMAAQKAMQQQRKAEKRANELKLKRSLNAPTGAFNPKLKHPTPAASIHHARSVMETNGSLRDIIHEINLNKQKLQQRFQNALHMARRGTTPTFTPTLQMTPQFQRRVKSHKKAILGHFLSSARNLNPMPLDNARKHIHMTKKHNQTVAKNDLTKRMPLVSHWPVNPFLYPIQQSKMGQRMVKRARQQPKGLSQTPTVPNSLFPPSLRTPSFRATLRSANRHLFKPFKPKSPLVQRLKRIVKNNMIRNPESYQRWSSVNFKPADTKPTAVFNTLTPDQKAIFANNAAAFNINSFAGYTAFLVNGLSTVKNMFQTTTQPRSPFIQLSSNNPMSSTKFSIHKMLMKRVQDVIPTHYHKSRLLMRVMEQMRKQFSSANQATTFYINDVKRFLQNPPRPIQQERLLQSKNAGLRELALHVPLFIPHSVEPYNSMLTVPVFQPLIHSIQGSLKHYNQMRQRRIAKQAAVEEQLKNRSKYVERVLTQIQRDEEENRSARNAIPAVLPPSATTILSAISKDFPSYLPRNEQILLHHSPLKSKSNSNSISTTESNANRIPQQRVVPGSTQMIAPTEGELFIGKRVGNNTNSTSSIGKGKMLPNATKLSPHLIAMKNSKQFKKQELLNKQSLVKTLLFLQKQCMLQPLPGEVSTDKTAFLPLDPRAISPQPTLGTFYLTAEAEKRIEGVKNQATIAADSVQRTLLRTAHNIKQDSTQQWHQVVNKAHGVKNNVLSSIAMPALERF